jgi:hypothetical protein
MKITLKKYSYSRKNINSYLKCQALVSDFVIIDQFFNIYHQKKTVQNYPNSAFVLNRIKNINVSSSFKICNVR